MATAEVEEEDGDWLPIIKSQREVDLLDTVQYSTVPERSAVILVLGESVAGKARFIQQLTQSEEIHISEKGQSEWESMQAYPMTIAGLTVSLVELPVFHLETESLVEVATWLSSMYTFGYQITGMVYLYPVDQADKSPSASKLRILKNLVGLDAVKDVVLVTTDWSQVSETNGALVKDTILKPWWSPLMEGGGSAMLRWLGDRESALKVINHLINRPIRLSTSAWKVQRELAVEGRAFPETGAGRALNEGLETRQQHYIDKLEAIPPKAGEIVGEGEEWTVVELSSEEQKARARLESVRKELLALQNCALGMKTQEEETKRFFRFMAHWERRLYKIPHQAFLGKGELDIRDPSPLKPEQPARIAMDALPNSFPWRLLLLALNLGLGAYAVFDMFRNSCATITSI